MQYLQLWFGQGLLAAGEKKVFTANMTVGATLAIIGFIMYSLLKLQKLQGEEATLPLKKPEQEPLTNNTSIERIESSKV